MTDPTRPTLAPHATTTATPAPEPMTAAQRATHDALFRHPLPRDLHWPEIRSMLGALAKVALGDDGSMRATANGRTLALGRPRKNVASVEELMEIRRFLARPDAT